MLNLSKLKRAERALELTGLPVSAQTIRQHLRLGHIEGLRIGGRWYTTPDAIRAAMVQVVGPGVKP